MEEGEIKAERTGKKAVSILNLYWTPALCNPQKAKSGQS